MQLDRVAGHGATGLVALESAIGTISRRGCATIVPGLQPQPAALIARKTLYA